MDQGSCDLPSPEPQRQDHTLADGSIRVCLSQGDLTACATVSSGHLAGDKIPQLKAALARLGDLDSAGG